jgi:hypothetical protein
MKQLLGRKSNPKMSGHENLSLKPGEFQPAGDLTGERVFPLHRVRSNPEILGPAQNMTKGPSVSSFLGSSARRAKLTGNLEKGR